MKCSDCLIAEREIVSGFVSGVYHKMVCRACLSNKSGYVGLSGGAASYNRRRVYEDNAQDTVQPYDAAGQPNVEFFRLYPDNAVKTFTPSEIEQVKRKI